MVKLSLLQCNKLCLGEGYDPYGAYLKSASNRRSEVRYINKNANMFYVHLLQQVHSYFIITVFYYLKKNYNFRLQIFTIDTESVLNKVLISCKIPIKSLLFIITARIV